MPELQDQVTNFFVSYENPTDQEVHDWAEKQGLDVHEVEEAIYRLATKYVNLVAKGEASKKGVSEEDVDPGQLKKGIKVELEHTDDPEIARKIALDHLAKFSGKNYYDELEKMEKKLKGKEKTENYSVEYVNDLLEEIIRNL